MPVLVLSTRPPMGYVLSTQHPFILVIYHWGEYFTQAATGA